MSRTVVAIVVACSVTAGISSASVAEAAGPKVPKGWKFEMPAGDPAAGKTAFIQANCNTCHSVPGTDIPQVQGGGKAPPLTPAYAKLPAAYLAESIANSHKVIGGDVEQYRGTQKVESQMRDYNSLITVQQMIDMVAFLKSLDQPVKAR